MNTKRRIAKYKGELDLAGFKLPCYVLEDETRVLSGRGMQEALKMVNEAEKSSGITLRRFLGQKSLKPFVSQEKRLVNFEPIIFYDGNKEVHGYKAVILADMCDVYLEARKNIHLSPRQKIIADRCEILMRAFAKVGIEALIDEATGYQRFRKKTLQEILKLYISPEILEWRKLFPISYYEELFKLWNWPLTIENMKRKPIFIGWLTNELVYKNLPKGVLEALKAKTPKTKGGHYKKRLHQSLTPNVGRKEAEKIIHEVEVLAWSSKDKNEFMRKMKARYHPERDLPYIDIEAMDDNKKETKVDKVLGALLKTPKPKKK